MRTSPYRVLKAVFMISTLSFLITSLNFFLRSDDDDIEIYLNHDANSYENVEAHLEDSEANLDDNIPWDREDVERRRMMDELYYKKEKVGNGSRLDAADLPGNLTSSDVQSIIWEKNREQLIRNLDRFDLAVSESTIVIVVQVHNRPEYLRHLVKSLSKARDIERTLVIFSHDFYSDELNKIVTSIDFCPVMQIYYPFSMQLHPTVFPGKDPRDCPRNLTRHNNCLNIWQHMVYLSVEDLPTLLFAEGDECFVNRAMESNCTNKEFPDRYGHYREAKYCQTKHHWFWKINHVFDYLDATRNFEGPVLFLEEDHYLVEDFVPILIQMHRLRTRSCTECNIMTLGNYDKKPAYGYLSAQVDVSPFLSSKHNMGMSLTRKLWNEIKECGKEFCRYDDYNWDWSINNIATSCTRSKFKVMVMKSPRIYHIGECGLHAKGANCNPLDRVSHIENLLKNNADTLFPQRIYIGGYPTIARKLPKPNGGWGDIRDHDLCISFLDPKSHV